MTSSAVANNEAGVVRLSARTVQLEFGRLIDRNFSRIGPFQDLVDLGCGGRQEPHAKSLPESTRALTSVRCGDVDDVADRHPSFPVKAMQDKLFDWAVIRRTGIKGNPRQ
jgi:hypothetical protein